MTDAPPDDGAAAPQGQVPAKRTTEAEWRRDRMEALLHQIDNRSDQLAILLADTGIGFPRFLEVIRRAFIKNPELIDADPASVIEACINAATDGLLPDGRQGAIVVYNVKVSKRHEPDRYAKRANWQPMYQGLLDIAYSSGNFRSIECRVVYYGDAFEYDLGDEPFIKHRPKSRPAGSAAPAIVAAYAVAKTVNGGVFREVFEGADIAKVNAVSRATNGPMKNWPEEAARKGPLRRMWKFLPKNEAMNRIIERDNEGFDLAALEDAAPAAPARERKLNPGFAALEQTADPVMPDMAMPPVEEGELVGAQTASNEPAKSYEAQGTAPDPDAAGHERQGREPPPAEDPPAVSGFEAQLAAAAGWLAVKQALKTFRKSNVEPAFDAIACSRAWQQMTALREEGKDKTDFVSDPLLFECWLLGVDPEPDRDTVEGNWAIVQADKAYARLPEDDQGRIAQRVAEILGAERG